MCNELNSDIGHNADLQKAVCDEQSVRYTNMITNSTNPGKAKWQKIRQTTRNQYLTMLHFDGLNRNAYGDL